MTVPDRLTRFDAGAAARAARFFDMDYADYEEDLPALKAFARRTGGPLLELGCGTGRLAVPLAEAGYQVTGVDMSPAMLAIARSRAAASLRLSSGDSPRLQPPIANRQSARGLVTLLEGDFASVPLGGPYRFAFTVMNTFLHLLTRDEQAAALRHWGSALAPGGLLLIDVFAPDVEELGRLDGQALLDKSWRDPETGAVVMKWVARTVEPAEQILHVTFLYDVIDPDGHIQRTVVPFDLRYLWRFEAEWLLEACGYAVEGAYGDWELNPFDSAGERLILVARK